MVLTPKKTALQINKGIVAEEVKERRRQLQSSLQNALENIARAEVEVTKYTARKLDAEKKLAAIEALYPTPEEV